MYFKVKLILFEPFFFSFVNLTIIFANLFSWSLYFFFAFLFHLHFVAS